MSEENKSEKTTDLEKLILAHQRLSNTFNNPPSNVSVTEKLDGIKSYVIKTKAGPFEIISGQVDWPLKTQPINIVGVTTLFPPDYLLKIKPEKAQWSPEAGQKIEIIFDELRKGYPQFTIQCEKDGTQKVDPLDVSTWSKEAAKMIGLEEYSTANCPVCRTTTVARH